MRRNPNPSNIDVGALERQVENQKVQIYDLQDEIALLQLDINSIRKTLASQLGIKVSNEQT